MLHVILQARTFFAANLVSVPFKQIIFVYVGSQAVDLVITLCVRERESEGGRGGRGFRVVFLVV